MTNVAKLIFGAALAAASIATAALAAYKSKPVSAHQNGYVTRGGQGSGIYDFTPVPPVHDPGAVPYHYVPGQASGGGGF